MKIFALLVLGTVACSYPKKARTVHVADVADPEATRIYNFMRDRGGIEETTHDWLLDEATIETLTARRACFDLTIRSRHSIDVHPSQWRVKVNGVDAEVVQREEPDKQFWTVNERTTETVYERTTPRGTTRVERPVEVERTTGYAVRQARACATLASRPSELELEVVLPQPGGMSNWGQRFAWRLTGGA